MTMSQTSHLSRRTLLRGLGTAMALPWLDIFGSSRARGADSGKPPLRMGFLYVPNGMNMAQWKPQGQGTDFKLPTTLQPLESLRENILFFSGLTHDKARPNGDGPGDHARASGAFLTGAQPRKTSGKDIRAGISVDQAAAQKIGMATRLASLELGCDQSAQSGDCDSGYSCAYSSNIAWAGPATPLMKEINPRLVFQRLFGDPTQMEAARQKARRLAMQRSVLDLVREDAKALEGKLGAADQRKLKEYLDGVRALEQSIQASEGKAVQALPPDYRPPEGVPSEYAQHIQQMLELMVLAFATDTTRIGTFMYANDGSNRTYPNIGVKDAHHYLSHHERKADKLAKIQKIDQFHVECMAQMLQKMASIQEGEGTLLDHSMIVYGCAIGDGNRHNHDDLPVLLAGKAGGTIATGRHLIVPSQTPMSNLFLSMLDRMETPLESFGDSTGRLQGLEG